MDAFSYLSVLLSVILGLAITQVLQGYRALALNRRRLTLYWPSLAWSAMVLLMVAQHWWASFGLTNRADWSFADFAAILVQTALIYMLAALVLPDMPADEPLDLKEHYWRERTAFFGVAIAVVGWSILREVILEGRLPERENLAFHVLFIAMAALALTTRRETVHKALAAIMAALFTAYIVALFAQLQ
jgi:hypothetical protein